MCNLLLCYFISLACINIFFKFKYNSLHSSDFEGIKKTFGPNYSQQIGQIKSMGFNDEAAIKNAFKLTNGDVNAAIEYLI